MTRTSHPHPVYKTCTRGAHGMRKRCTRASGLSMACASLVHLLYTARAEPGAALEPSSKRHSPLKGLLGGAGRFALDLMDRPCLGFGGRSRRLNPGGFMNSRQGPGCADSWLSRSRPCNIRRSCWRHAAQKVAAGVMRHSGTRVLASCLAPHHLGCEEYHPGRPRPGLDCSWVV
jgi:hypothetical protein